MTGSRVARWSVVVLVAAACAFGLWQAVARMWICDDAFISFRYAENLLAGHGLVYNAGERVEGYTNFLWTMLIAAAVALGAETQGFAQWAGIACFAATVLLLLLRAPRSPVWVPVAAVGLVLHRHSQEFATCGLETALFTLLVLGTVLRSASAERPAHWAQAGLLGVLAAMTRPDGAVFCAVAALGALASSFRTSRPGNVLAFVLPFVLLYLPYFVWKWSYYGYPLPNTFYAKSGGDPYPGQGLYYVLLYFETYWVLVPGVFLLPVLALRPGGSRLARLACAACLLYLAFVVWVGGDFMFGRFLVPITPLLFLGWELAAERWPRPAGRVGLLVAVAAGALLASWHPELQGSGPDYSLRGIGDEREQYPPRRVAFLREVGRRMGEVVPDARVVFFGTQAMLVYEAGFAYALEGTTGLTDEHLAHMELDARGPVGHEKSIYRDPAYVLERRVHFMLAPDVDLVGRQPYRAIELFGLPATVVIYDRELMRRLRGVEGVEFVDFERYLDSYIAGLDGRDPAEVLRDLAAFRVYYFDHNEDPARLQAIERAAR